MGKIKARHARFYAGRQGFSILLEGPPGHAGGLAIKRWLFLFANLFCLFLKGIGLVLSRFAGIVRRFFRGVSGGTVGFANLIGGVLSGVRCFFTVIAGDFGLLFETVGFFFESVFTHVFLLGIASGNEKGNG